MTARRPVIEIRIAPPAEVRSVSFTNASCTRTQTAEVDATDCTKQAAELASVWITADTSLPALMPQDGSTLLTNDNCVQCSAVGAIGDAIGGDGIE